MLFRSPKFSSCFKGLLSPKTFLAWGGFRASNNIAEYEALLARSRAVLDLGAREVEIYSDSRLEVSQVQGNFEA